jgi:quinoprotein dehydrogenase-associated probable ABC transporter substrate-binding protein
MRPRVEGFVLAALVMFSGSAQADTLRVCADPSNLPFSNRDGAGFENKIAQLVGRDLGETVTYDWEPQRANSIERAIADGKCDLAIGVPKGLDTLETTRPYYASSYVFVSRSADNLHLTSLRDMRLRKLKIGVHLIGDDDAPPEVALGEEGIVDNVTGFMIYGDTAKPNPPSRLIEAVEARKIDVAIVWGPLGGYFAARSPVPLTVTPLSDAQSFAPLKFSYAIAMGVRKGDFKVRARLDAVLVRERAAIAKILASYGVPLVGAKESSDG